MDREKLESWVKDKLDSGVDPERVKKSLENTDHDSSVVDEVVESQSDPAEESGDRGDVDLGVEGTAGSDHPLDGEETGEVAQPLEEEEEDGPTDEIVEGSVTGLEASEDVEDFHEKFSPEGDQEDLEQKDSSQDFSQPKEPAEQEEQDVEETSESQEGSEEPENVTETEEGVKEEQESKGPEAGNGAYNFEQTQGQSSGTVDISDRAEEVKQIGAGFEKGVEHNWKPLVAGLFLVAFIGLGALYGPEFIDSEKSPEEEQKQRQPPDKVEKASLPDRQEPSIEGEEVRVVLTDKLAKPARASINGSEGVRLANNASKPFNVSFDTSIKSFVLPAGKSWLVAPDSITYYSAKPLEEGKEVKGSVYVE